MPAPRPEPPRDRDGRGLSALLLGLVDGDPAERLRAAEALQAIEMGVPDVHVDLDQLEELPDFELQEARFVDGVRKALAAAEFDTGSFVRRLCALRITLQESWGDHVGKELERQDAVGSRFDRLAAPVVERIRDATDEAARETAVARFVRLAAAAASTACRGDGPLAAAEAMSATGFVSHRVFDVLAEELLAAPDALEELLDQPRLRHEALAALARIGPAAESFVPRLLDDLDARAGNGSGALWFDAAAALAAVGSASPELPGQLVRRVDSLDPAVRHGALEVLQLLGDDVGPPLRDALLERLEWLLADPGLRPAALLALASVGRRDPAVRERVIGLARPQPPRLAPWGNGFEDLVDHAMLERAVALEAMQSFADWPEEVLPVALAALDDFEELDPDVDHAGPCARVARLLGALGPAAAPAAAALAARLDDDPETFPCAILDALEAMGPAAAAAVPELVAFRRRREDPEEPWPDLDDPGADRSEDRVGRVILALRNGLPRKGAAGDEPTSGP